MPTSRIRVTVVEDDSRLRRTFTDILESADDCECVSVFAAGALGAECSDCGGRRWVSRSAGEHDQRESAGQKEWVLIPG
jgi:hypothetical protein